MGLDSGGSSRGRSALLVDRDVCGTELDDGEDAACGLLSCCWRLSQG